MGKKFSEIYSLNAIVQVIDTNPNTLVRARALSAHNAISTLEEIEPVNGVIVATPASDHANTIKVLDSYMWKQFYTQSWVRVTKTSIPTVVFP